MGGCAETAELLNAIFEVPAILNDGHEILARLNAGDDLSIIVQDLNPKFGKPRRQRLVNMLTSGWPSLHREAVSNVVRWALEKLDTDDRILIEWKGDAESPDTVTGFELRDHVLVISLAHPPGRLATS